MFRWNLQATHDGRNLEYFQQGNLKVQASVFASSAASTFGSAKRFTQYETWKKGVGGPWLGPTTYKNDKSIEHINQRPCPAIYVKHLSFGWFSISERLVLWRWEGLFISRWQIQPLHFNWREQSLPAEYRKHEIAKRTLGSSQQEFHPRLQYQEMFI